MENQGITYIRNIPELAPLLEHANHVDVKTVTGSVDMRTFLANMLAYQPGWITFLYYIRAGFVRCLGMRQKRIPASLSLRPENVPMQIGERVSFFKLHMVKEERYLIASAKDKHLDALLGVVIEPLANRPQKRFHVLTVVHYNNWTGPLYFQAIKPFHHLVVGSMAEAGIHPTNKRRATIHEDD